MTPSPETPQQTEAPEKPRQRSSNADLLALVVESGVRENYAKQIVEAELTRDLFEMDQRLARVFAMSGAFKELDDSKGDRLALAMTKIQIGRSWGIGPADAMQFIYFTNGRPAIQQELYAASMRQKGFDWDIDWQMTGTKCTGCTLWLKKDGQPVLDRKGNPVSESFTKDDADGAMIWEKGQQIRLSDKWNFKSWPKDMYFWRALSRLRKFHATDVLRGARTQEELEDEAPPTNVAQVNTERKMPELREKLAKGAVSLTMTVPSTAAGPSVPTADSLKEKLKTPPVQTAPVTETPTTETPAPSGAKEGDLF